MSHESNRKLRVAIEHSLTSLNPFFWKTFTDVVVGKPRFQNLISFDQELRMIPELARRWELTKDSCFFELTEGITFADGEPLDAGSAIWNLRNNILPRAGLADLLISESIIDKYRFSLRFSEIPFTLLANLASPQGFLISPNSSELVPIGSGHFSLDDISQNGNLTLKRRTKTIGDSRYKRIEFIPLKDGWEMWQSLLQGDVDIIYECPYSIVKNPHKIPSIIINSTPSISVNMMHFNLNKPPFNSRVHRRILADAIDKSELFRKGNEGVGDIAVGPVPRISPYFANSSHSFANSASIQKIGHFELLAAENYNELWLKIFRDQVSTAGGSCTVHKLPWSNLISRLEKGEFEAALWGTAGSPEPYDMLYSLFHSEGLRNFSRFQNSEFEQSLYLASRTFDFEKRKDFYRQAINILDDNLPVIWLRHGRSILVHRENIGGIIPYPDNYLRLEGSFAKNSSQS